MLRCPLCYATTHRLLFDGFLCCQLCSLAFTPDTAALKPLEFYCDPDGTYTFPNWNNWRTRLTGRLPPLPDQSPYFAPVSVRMFAARQRYRVVDSGSGGSAAWHDLSQRFTTVLRDSIAPLDPVAGPDPRLTLGVIAATGAWADVLSMWQDLNTSMHDIVVALDTADSDLAASRGTELASVAEGRRCQVIAHPLNRDFAAQRNRVQQAAKTEWVLQLDCDERLTAGTPHLLSGVLDDANRLRWAAVALTRRNVVDGVVSAFYPDVQYRLVRNDVRFTRAVHEHPDLGSRQKSFVHLGVGIVHTLASERFVDRETFYDGIERGAGRSYDTGLLRTPLEPGVTLTP